MSSEPASVSIIDLTCTAVQLLFTNNVKKMSLLSVWLELLEFDFGTQSAIMWITLMLKNLC